jgi:hypothetical protein
MSQSRLQLDQVLDRIARIVTAYLPDAGLPDVVI